VTLKMACKHVWMEIESDLFGKPTKYKCVNCPVIYVVKKDVRSSDYLDKINSIRNRTYENIQKIEFIKLNPIGFNESLHLNHLINENKTFEILLNQ